MNVVVHWPGDVLLDLDGVPVAVGPIEHIPARLSAEAAARLTTNKENPDD